MKAFLKWLAGVLGSVLTLLLTIVLLPHAGTFADWILPDAGGNHIQSAAILSQEMKHSARLETMTVEGKGVMIAERKGLLIGTVSTENVSYLYKGSFGIDLSRVQVQIRGNQLTLLLPQPEALMDTAEVLDSDHDGFLDSQVRFSQKELQELLNVEKEKFREQYLTGEYAQALREKTLQMLDATVTTWLKKANSRCTVTYEWAAPDASANEN